MTNYAEIVRKKGQQLWGKCKSYDVIWLRHNCSKKIEYAQRIALTPSFNFIYWLLWSVEVYSYNSEKW